MPGREPVFREFDDPDVPWQRVKAQRNADGTESSVWEKWFAFSNEPQYLSLYARYDPGMVVRRHGHFSPHIVFVVEGEVWIGVDDALWRRFRGAQDTFFGARDETNAKLDAEYAANAEVKEKLLADAEALLPITDLEAAKRSFREIGERWEAAGKVPRDRIKELEGRMRTVEQAIRSLEDEHWRRSDPEKSARADDMVTQLEAAIAQVEADLAQARSAGNDKRVRELEENLASRQSFLDMARRVSADYS